MDPSILEFRRGDIQENLDFSLCGGLPPPVKLTPNLKMDVRWYLDQLLSRIPWLGKSKAGRMLRWLLFGRRLPVDYVPYSTMLAFAQMVEAFYRPLRGELDIHLLADAMLHQATLYQDALVEAPKSPRPRPASKLSRLLKPNAAHYAGRSSAKAELVRYLAGESSFFQQNRLAPVQKAVSYFSQSYPRIMDRRTLIEAAARVSKSLELYGPGLSAHEFALPYFRGVIETQDELLRVYCRSRINLGNNTHGFGLHSRTLECMAVGRFIFMHESPHDNKPGGMLTSFQPGVHYGAYTPENFTEQAERWLRDTNGRIRAGMRAASVIRERHCWHHRAQQILADLNR